MFELLAKLADWFNASGFQVGAGSIVSLLVLASEDIAFTDQEDFVILLQTCFAKTQTQSQAVPALLDTFIRNRNIQQTIAALKKKKEEQAQNTSFRNDYDDRIQDINSREQKAVDEFRRQHPLQEPLSEENRKELTDLSGGAIRESLSPETDRLIFSCLEDSQKAVEDLLNSEGTVRIELSEKMEDALWNMEMDQFDAFSKIIDCLDSIRKKTVGQRESIQAGLEAIRKSYQAERKQADDDYRKQKKEHEKAEKELDQKLQELMESSAVPVLHKNGSKNHREQFIGGTHAVWSEDLGETVCLTKDLAKLSEKEAKAIHDSIRRNALRMKTKLMRSLYAGQPNHIDMNETIRSACRTGGLPMRICMEHARPKKAKLVLILDISGSCSGASKMMLHMMHSLQSVFPSGCKAYAFVNSLYDISRIMNSRNAEDAVKAVFETIPTRGVYSDYNVPLRTMWEKHQSEITSDTTLIMIGDARNNRRDSGERYLKNLARKSRKAYWLNTEKPEKWGQGDSIAPLYAQYMQMLPVQTAEQLIRFVTNMK